MSRVENQKTSVRPSVATRIPGGATEASGTAAWGIAGFEVTQASASRQFAVGNAMAAFGAAPIGQTAGLAPGAADVSWSNVER